MAALAPEVKFREVWAWSMYDFANSAYTTVVITAVFGAYFVSVVAAGKAWATFAWTAALSASYAGTPHHRSPGRRMRRRACSQEGAAARDHGRVCNIHGGAVLRGSRRRR